MLYCEKDRKEIIMIGTALVAIMVISGIAGKIEKKINK